MGRYYDTENGRGGKFMLGVQPSDDPEFMGMVEIEPSHIEYYADENNIAAIKDRLDSQYDLLDVPKEKRIYYCKDYQEMEKFEKEVLHDKVFTTVDNNDKKAIEEHEQNLEDRWYSGKDGYTDYAPKAKTLTLGRIRLALDILSDIKDTGSCSLNAEL